MLEKIKKYEYLMRSSFIKRKPEIIKHTVLSRCIGKTNLLINRPYYFSFKRRWTNSVSTQSNYNVMSVVYIYIAIFHIRSRQGSYFQPTNQRSNNEVVGYQDRVHTTSCYPDDQCNCRAYDWSVKDE